MVSFTVADLTTFVDWADGDTAVKEAVDGLGDAAFVGPSTAAEDPQVLVFRKGTRAVRLVSIMKSESGDRLVSSGQLREIADLIASRM